MTTRGEWATEFLHAIGNSNPDAKTVNFVATWTLGENTQAQYNPLATKQPSECQTGSFNDVGVRNYSTDQCGIDATVKTLENGYYPHILHGLQNNDPEEASNAIELGTWGTGTGFLILWREGDHRNEVLLSHGAQGSGEHGRNGSSEVPVTNVPIVGKGGGGGGSWDTGQKPNIGLPDTAVIARNVEFIALGTLLVGIAIVLAVRTYVPVQQVVQTIGAVAG